MLIETPKNVYTTYNDVVYKFSGHGGSVLWTFALTQAYEPDRRIGSFSQLAIVDDVVYAALEYRIYALRASSGQELWHYSPQLTSAELAEDRGRIFEMIIDKSVMYLKLTHGDMLALDLHDGSLKWSHLSFPNGGSFSPSDDTLYASEFSQENGPILHAIDGKTGKQCWQFKRALTDTSRSYTFIFNGIVYSSGKPLYALDAHTGKQLWEQGLADGPYFSGLQICNGVVYVNTNAVLWGRGDIPLDFFRTFAFDAQTGKHLWASQPGYQYCAKVSDDGKRLLVKSVVQKEESLQMLDAKTGVQLWQIALEVDDLPEPHPLHTEIEVSENLLYMLTYKRPYTLQVFDVLTGKPLRQHPIALGMKEELNLSAWSNDALYICSSVHEGDGYYSGSSDSFSHYFIYAIRLVDGAVSWRYDAGSLVDVQMPITGLKLAP